jgi:hypothetical protein
VLLRVVSRIIGRRASTRTRLVLVAGRFLWRRVAAARTATAVVTVPHGSKVVVQAVKERP